MSEEKIINIPNALSLYRILVFPLAFWFLLSGQEEIFSIFLCINLITDLLDGFIARTFNMVTKLGARLDSLGDIGTYILAFVGVIKFKSADLAVHGLIFYLFIFLYVSAMAYHFLKFGSFASFHLYSTKITGYLQGTVFFLWFFIGFYPVLFYISMVIGVLAELETLVIISIIKQRSSNVKGLSWIFKNKTSLSRL
jgi:cardiolipin synthase